MEQNHLVDKKGLTLIEILLAVVIMSVVLIILSSIIIQIFNVVGVSNQRMTGRQLAEINLSKLVSLVRNSDEINDNTIIIKENDSSKEIKYDSTNNIITQDGNELINNVSFFSIDKDEDSTIPEEDVRLYKITFVKCIDEDCEEKIEMNSRVLQRK